MSSPTFDHVLNAKLLSETGGINQNAIPWILLTTLVAAAGVLAVWPESMYIYLLESSEVHLISEFLRVGKAKPALDPSQYRDFPLIEKIQRSSDTAL